MKVRSFLIALSATLLALVLTAIGLWTSLESKSPIRLVNQPLELPRAARFVPRQSDLTIHWMIDPNQLPRYAEAVASTRHRKDAREAVKKLRDGTFALAGLDFDTELADWIGPKISLSLIKPTGKDGTFGWVMALSSRDEDGAKRFLQRFWQARSLAGTDLQITSYRGMGIISGRNTLAGTTNQPLATALIDNDLLLIASSRGLLEESLDISQLSDQHQLADKELQDLLPKLRDGIALITASPEALNSWLDVPNRLVERDDLKGFIGSVTPIDANLGMKGILRFNQPLEGTINTSENSLELVNSSGGPAESLAILSAPAKLIDPTSEDPISQLIGPLIQKQLSKKENSTAKIISELNDNSLIWLKEPEGWVIGTEKEHPNLSTIDEILSKQDLVRSDLTSENQTIQAWSKLITKRGRNNDTLDTELAVVLSQDSNQNWWGENLAALQQRNNANALQPRLKQLQRLNEQGEQRLSQQIALGSNPAQKQLKDWQPWRILQAIAGRSFQPAIKGLSIALGADENTNSSLIYVRAQLEIS